MNKLIEVIDSLNDESAQDVEALRNTLKSEAEALIKNNRTLYSRAKTAEGFVYNKATKEWIKKAEPVVEKPAGAEPIKSNEPDYARLAFLEQRGLTNPDDQKMVQDEAERLKMPLTDILSMDHIKSRLELAKDQREAQAGMPKGRGSGSSKTQQDVDYWLAKPQKSDGTYETPDDFELANKVIEARINKEKQTNKFSDELYTG